MNKSSLLLLLFSVQIFLTGCHDEKIKNSSIKPEVNTAIPPSVESKLEEYAKQKQYDKGLALLRPYAEQGNPDAQFATAIGIIQKGGNINTKEVLDWTRKAASQGQREAISLLSESYRWGNFNLPTNQVMSDMWKDAATDTNRIPECMNYERSILFNSR